MEILNAGGSAGDRIIKEPEMALFSLEHTSNCDVRNCGFPGCCKMRIIIDHAKAHWSVDEPNNCIICKNFAKVVRKHTQYCFDENCLVHNCNILKSKISAIEAQISVAERDRRETEMAEKAKEAGLIL
ncbi:Oidioi.mRNA.OKI2018_I69.PAR.g9787.t1.cds [Oikopleura dioica]|uniref:histone acetyltransferase n=1 Tax=Oikopleura dioica TaxID=34765 RepID=A0ABN7RRN5_OIKDI|nr:Oidioi.mRNA.OKI2018_I69.PAR.g9787.t1.cds [Oikopleura dioica]